MAQVFKIDSNVTGLRYQKELSIGVADPTNPWVPLEPNSYADFGGSVTTVARNPINADRKRKKGVTTDLDASGGFNMDLTQINMQDIMQGFMFADLEPKAEFGGAGQVTTVDGAAEEYEAASGLTVFRIGDLVLADNFTNTANNGLKRAIAVSATALGVFENLVAETPPAAATLVQVGFQFAAGDADIDASLAQPALTTTTKDLTQLGLIPGEWIFIGGDIAANQFDTAANNGFARVFSVATNRIVFDKTASTMVTEANVADTIQIFFGRRLRDRTGSDIVRSTYQLERTLGAPDDALPAEIQAQYLEGSVANEFTINVPTAEKITIDMSFIAINDTQNDGPTALKAGARPDIVESDAFNTSSDVTTMKMHVYDSSDSNPSPLFAFIQELTITINNNASPNKAVGVLGAFEVTVGTFQVGGSLTAYFSDVAAVSAVRNNEDITMHLHLAKANAGISFDLPLITLGDGRPNVEQDQPITLPLSNEAATGAKIDPTLNHTLMIVFFDYLPSAAD
jgi:hypothetical protein